jgi:hypothetical protein
MNTKEIGNQLEELVVSKIKVIEPTCRRTKGSGNSTELEDILSSNFLVQCKVDNVHENIIIKKKDWLQLYRKLPINSKRTPIFVNQQRDGIVTITLDINDYFRTIYKLYDVRGEI